MPLLQIKFQPQIMRVTTEKARLWAPSAIGFVGTIGMAALLFTETVPRVRRDILSKVPILGNYWSSQVNK